MVVLKQSLTDLRSGQSIGSTSTGGANLEQDPDDRQAWFRSMWEGKAEQEPARSDEQSHDADEDDDFDEDFDDFAEEGEEDDFGDFDEATPTPAPVTESQPVTSLQSIFSSLVSSYEIMLDGKVFVHADWGADCSSSHP